MAADALEDRATVEAIVRNSGTSFYWALRVLPAEERGAMFAVYAYCRQVDDIADSVAEVGWKKDRLRGWRSEIERLYRGIPTESISRALVEPIHRYGLRRQDFEAILDGMEMDAADRVRIADGEELALYCDRVACAVGRLSVRVFGTEGASGDRLANTLGKALQLTNILRDLGEDARRNRLYLPADLLQAEGVRVADNAVEALHQPGTVPVCEHLAALASDRFAEAEEIIAGCDRRQLRPAKIMLEVYRRTLGRLVSRGWNRWAQPVSVSGLEKVWIAVRYGLT
jgi:phytoene synthase